MKYKLAITLCLILIVLIFGGLYGPMIGSQIEHVIWKHKLNNQINKINAENLPNRSGGELYKFKDGWVVILYGSSKWFEHGAWNYNMAKDSNGNVYACTKHFCSPIKARGQMYIDGKKGGPCPKNDELEAMEKLITSEKLDDALSSLYNLEFKKMENAANK